MAGSRGIRIRLRAAIALAEMQITFCRVTEMAGWLHLKIDIIREGVAKYKIKDPTFKTNATTPNHRLPSHSVYVEATLVF